MIHLYFITDPNRRGTVQEIIYQKYGTFEVPCMRDKIYAQSVDSELDNKDDSELEVEDGILTVVHMMH